MAIQKTEAILLKKKDLRETSLVLTFFTRDFGKVQGVLKGARGSRARSSVNPLYFSLDQIVFYENKKRDLFIISQCEAQQIFLNILKDWERARVAYYLLELVDVFTEPNDRSEETFECLSNSLVALDEKKEASSIARLFEVKLLMSLGLWPGRECFKLTKGAMSTLAHFEEDKFGVSSKIKLDSSVGNEIRIITGKIIADNLEKPLKTVRIFG
jgi:DNA repair protein RecO (recombination protein O)